MSLGLGPRSVDDVFKSKKIKKKNVQKNKPSKGKTHFRMQYFDFHLGRSEGGETIRGKMTKKLKKIHYILIHNI